MSNTIIQNVGEPQDWNEDKKDIFSQFNPKIQELIQEIRRIKCERYISYMITIDEEEQFAIPANTEIERAIKKDGRFNIIGYHTIDNIKIFAPANYHNGDFNSWEFDSYNDIHIESNDQVIKDNKSYNNHITEILTEGLFQDEIDAYAKKEDSRNMTDKYQYGQLFGYFNISLEVAIIVKSKNIKAAKK